MQAGLTTTRKGWISEGVDLPRRPIFRRRRRFRGTADNAASRRVLEKAGYVCEGILRRGAIKDGKVRDQAMYALVR